MTTYALGPFRLDTQDELLFRGEEPLALGRRAIALLRTLVERPGGVIAKDALIEAAWPGQAVEESNLTVQIAALRRVLGEAPGGDRWIETMPRRGYRFVGPVITEEQQSAIEALPRADAQPDLVHTSHGEDERRQITVMSCELIDLAKRTDGIDLEDRREAVAAFQRWVSRAADRHQGFVYRYLGNNALVLFGYPAAHEHDAEESVSAGLELCAAVKTLRPGENLPTRCRVGIATGMVIVGDDDGPGANQEHEIVGDAPDLATRLQMSAQPDTVVVGSASHGT
jgi:DNA-binding winged helix-turn-helix (wHTH) protein